ncbi:MAG: PEP-CTERM sorting domain-containing protein [Fimbriimonadales bacterium]
MKCWAPAALGLCAFTASADIVILVGPGNVFGDENVLYNEAGLLDNGPLVQGITNQTGAIVDFFGAGEDLVTPPRGQARVEAVDGAFTDLMIALHAEPNTFTSLIFNLNAAAKGPLDIIVSQESGGPIAGTFDLDPNGENFFRIIASKGFLIELVTIDSSVDIQDIKQVRIGGVVPEPSSLFAAAIGLCWLLACRRRR